jgi:hypothetical protein
MDILTRYYLLDESKKCPKLIIAIVRVQIVVVMVTIAWVIIVIIVKALIMYYDGILNGKQNIEKYQEMWL